MGEDFFGLQCAPPLLCARATVVVVVARKAIVVV